MLGLLGRRSSTPTKRRFGWDDLYEQVNFLGNTYPLGLQFSGSASDEEKVDHNYEGFAEIYRRSGPVFSCVLARTTLFAEARFQYQRFVQGRSAELYGNNTLRVLERPWPNGDTGELLTRAEQDVSLAGNWYLHRLRPDRLQRLRPDWVSILLGSKLDVNDVSKAIDAEVLSYVYEPPGEERQFLEPKDVVHWSPIPDPLFRYRGMSWLPAAILDVDTDRQAALHREAFFRNSATTNFVVLPDKDVGYEEFKDFREDFEENYVGAWNAYRTLFLGGGSDVKVLGLDFEKMDFKSLQGAGETRVAAVSNVPPIIAGFSEGLASATYSNYGQARRKFGDHYARPQWRSVSNALSKFVSVQGDSRLWYDDRDIPFLREDLTDESKIRMQDAQTIRTLVDGGYEPDRAVKFVQSGNLAVLLGGHSGLVPVQLNPADGGELGSGSDEEEPAEEEPTEEEAPEEVPE